MNYIEYKSRGGGVRYAAVPEGFRQEARALAFYSDFWSGPERFPFDADGSDPARPWRPNGYCSVLSGEVVSEREISRPEFLRRIGMGEKLKRFTSAPDYWRGSFDWRDLSGNGYWYEFCQTVLPYGSEELRLLCETDRVERLLNGFIEDVEDLERLLLYCMDSDPETYIEVISRWAYGRALALSGRGVRL